ncbi:hypothetical protein C1646_759822 [Rhizophagus diaphanus]|nr:hypothetical protein C1646_759822 [Rhizophagus diaphanus] [Rhizophagus sp. MUCL 43196]
MCATDSKQFLERYNLSVESSPEQLSEHVPELNALLPDWKAHKCVKEIWDQKEHLAEYGANPELIDHYAKDSKMTTASNKIQQERTEKRLADPGKTSDHFTFEKVLRRLQNIDTSKIPSMQDFADVIVMLSMRPAERDKLMPVCLLSMEKNPERARELLTWIQNAIKAGKLRDPVYTKTEKRNNVPFAKFIKSLKTNQDKDEITPEVLRKIEAKYVSMVYASPNPTPQHLDHLSEIAIRHKINRLES